MSILQLTLGILTAAGGFIDISNIVFNSQGGAKFGYHTLWVTVLGAIGIAVYSEICGRIAAVTKQPVYNLVRERTGFLVGLLSLIAANTTNILTCAAELGGVAIILKLFFALSYPPALVISVIGFIILIWLLKFEWIERLFGVMGLGMMVFVIAAFMLHPKWNEVAVGFLPNIPSFEPTNLLLYLYFVIGILSSVLMPYETYFYSSGGVEEGWTPKNLTINKITAYFGFGVGSLVAVALTIIGAELFLPHGIYPQSLGTVALAPLSVLGKGGLFVVLTGMLFAIGGAAVETCFSAAYSICQFFGWEWGRAKEQHNVPQFTIVWIAVFILSGLILSTGIDPVKLTTYAVIFSVVVLPFSYLPIILVANDKLYMGQYKNGKITNTIAWIYFFILMVVSITAIPLLILTNGGSG